MKISDDDLPKRRRHEAKRLNENLKLVATSMNNLAVTSLAAAVVLPAISGTQQTFPWFWVIVAATLHAGAHTVLRGLRRED